MASSKPMYCSSKSWYKKSLIAAICLIFIVIASPIAHASSNSPITRKPRLVLDDPGDEFVKTWWRRQPLQSWQPWQRKVMESAFREIQRKAPGLVERASNGMEIHVVLGRDGIGERGTAIAQTDPFFIICFHQVFDYPEDVRYVLCHELVHAVDTDSVMSDSQEWNKVIGPYITRYRRVYKPRLVPYSGVLDQRSARVGLPSPFAASDSTEALAEQTAAMLIGNWNPPGDVKAFIFENILSQPKGLDRKRYLLRQASAFLETGNYSQCVSLCTDAMRLDRDCASAWCELGYAWDYCGEPELKLFAEQQALALLRGKLKAPYSRDIRYCLDMRKSAYDELVKDQKKFRDRKMDGFGQNKQKISKANSNLVKYRDQGP